MIKKFFVPKLLLLYSLGIVLFVIDRLSKIWALYYLPDRGIFIISGEKWGGLGFKLYLNTGVAWSISILPKALMILVIGLIALLVGVFIRQLKNLYTKKDWYNLIFLFFIIIGAISNFWDRIQYGWVIDFINIFVWPVFNLADLFIVLGVFGVLVLEIFNKKKKASQ